MISFFFKALNVYKNENKNKGSIMKFQLNVLPVMLKITVNITEFEYIDLIFNRLFFIY